MIARTRLLLANSRFARNTAVMSVAGITAHGLFLAASPILTRLFSPEDFAVLVLFTTAQALLLTCATGRVEWSVPNAQEPREAQAMIAAAFGILGMFCLALLSCAIFLPMAVLDYATNTPISRNMLILLSFSVLFAGSGAILQSWFIAKGTLKRVSQSRIAMAACYVTMAIILGLIAANGTTLIVSFVFSHLIAASVLIRGSGALTRDIVTLSVQDIRSVLRMFRPEILASLASSVIHVLSFYLMFLLIWWRFDAVILGWFALVFRIAMAPIGLLTASLAKGFWAEAADLAKHDPARLRWLYLRLNFALCGPAIACAAVTLSAPQYFGTIFGAEWAGAGDLLAGLTPMLVALIVLSSTNHFIVYRRQHWQAWCDLTSIALMLTAFYIAHLAAVEPATTVWLTSSAFLISYLIRFALHLRANTLHSATVSTKDAMT